MTDKEFQTAPGAEGGDDAIVPANDACPGQGEATSSTGADTSALATSERIVRGKNSRRLAEGLALIGISFRYNIRSGKPETMGIVPANTNDRAKAKKRFLDMSDYSEARARELLKSGVKVETFKPNADGEPERVLVPLAYNETAWKQTLPAMLFERQVDPFSEYLADCHARHEPTREPMLERHLCELFDVENNRLNRWAARAIFLGAIHRAKRPGCKLDQTVVLFEPHGGRGKSAYTKHILPFDDHPEWHTDALSLAGDPKRQAEALDGRVVVELAEMRGASKAEVDALKSFLTRTDDGGIRRAYARYMPTKLRRCIFIGTTNKAEFLPDDEALLRRFVPIKVERGCDVETYMAEFRERLWGEAMTLYAGMSEAERNRAVNISPNPNDPLNKDQHDRAREFVVCDGILEDRIAALPAEGDGETLEVIMERLGRDDTSAAKQGEVAAALARAGWTKDRRMIDGKRVWRWYAPEAAPTAEAA